jgi:hypothetical protein
MTYGKYLVEFYLSLGVLWLVLIGAWLLFLGRNRLAAWAKRRPRYSHRQRGIDCSDHL